MLGFLQAKPVVNPLAVVVMSVLVLVKPFYPPLLLAVPLQVVLLLQVVVLQVVVLPHQAVDHLLHLVLAHLVVPPPQELH